METISNPSIIVSLILGTPVTLVTTYSYSADGFKDNAFVSFVQDPETKLYQLFIGQSPSDVANLVTEQVIIGPVRDNIQFQVDLSSAEYVVLTCIQDHYQHLQLESTLDREFNQEVWFNRNDLWQILVEGRISFDLNWQVTSSTYLLPFLDYELNEEEISQSLDQLTERGLLIRSEKEYYSPSDDLLLFFDYFLPVISFAAINYQVIKKEDELSVTHMVFIRGNSVNLIIQPVIDKDGKDNISIFTAGGTELAALLFELGLQDQELVELPDDKTEEELTLNCPNCGHKLEQNIEFCSNCGFALRVKDIAKNKEEESEIVESDHKCMNCGAVLQSGSKYCTQCGSELL
jgi:hypothetical protein